MSSTVISMDAMKSILTKVEDIHNSQAALNQKIAVVQMALDEAPNEELQRALAEAYSNANRNAELIREASHKYEMAMNAASMGDS